MATMTITVSTAAELTAALSKATGGETILLNPGSYGMLKLTTKSGFDITYNSEVTIRSADATRPAVFTGLDINGAANLSFRDLMFDHVSNLKTTTNTTPFSIINSRDMAISGSTFDGDVAKAGTASEIGYPTARGLKIGNCTNFDFIDNTMHTFYKGLTVGSSDNVRVIGNDIHSMRSDGMNLIGPQGLLIEDNHFHDFVRAPGSGDHADMIQFWTTNSNRPTTDVTIRGNLFDVGQGSTTHTILMRNDQVDQGLAGPEMYFRNVLIEQNTIYNNHLHGISVGETDGLVIRNNAVLQAAGTPGEALTVATAPRIGVATASTNVTITDNISYKVAGGLQGYNGLPAGWTVGNNLLAQNLVRTDDDHYSTLFVSTTTDSGGPGGHAFVALPGGTIETMGVGPDSMMIDRTPAAVTPIFHVGVLPSDDSFLVFDAAGSSYGPLGSLASGGATFLWNFGDGTTTEGGVVTHRYAAPGTYAVTLEIVQADGSSTVVTETVQKLGTDLLRFDSKTGKFAASDGFSETMINIAAGALAGSTTARTIDLDAAKKTSVAPAAIESLFGADNFVLNLQLKADLTPDSSGNVIRLQNVLTGDVTRSGNFSFTLNIEGAPKVTVISAGTSLLDGKAHDVRIAFDGDLGVLSIAVDGKAPVTTQVTGNLPAMGSWGLTFGNPPAGAPAFDGKLLTFDLDVDRSNYPTYETGTAVVSPGAGLAAAGARFAAAPAAALAAVTPDDDMPGVTLDDYVLDGTAMAGLNPKALRGDARLVLDGGETLLSFDGSGDAVYLKSLSQFKDADRLAVQIDFQREAADGSTGVLASNNGQFQLSVAGDGFRLIVATADEGMKAYNIGALGLNDTDRHEAVVIVDAVADRLQVILDNRLVFEDDSTDLVMTTPEGGRGGWRLGRDFEGQIADFRIDDDIGHQVATGDVVAFA